MKVIKCKSGNIFAMCNSNYIDAEWILQESYYKAQGCIIEEQESASFGSCECDHCKSLEHKFHELIDEVKEI